MNPLNSNLGSSAENTGQITWTGPAITCLGICKGDKLNKVMTLIASKVCELAAPMDLSALTLQCALDIFSKDEAGNRTLSNVLQLLIDNECGLKELIDNIQDQIDGIRNNNLVLDLRCLGIAPGYTVETALQGLINAVCDIKVDLSTLTGRVNNLNTQLQDHLNEDVVIPEVKIATCITPSDTVISQSVIQLAASYCDYKGAVGTKAHIQTALSRQTSDINEKMASVVGWIATPLDMAQLVNNLFLYEAFNDARITNIENNCCKVTCRDIKIGFDILVSESTISVVFSDVAGTDIPAGMEDLGSQLIISDSNNTSLNYKIAVANNTTRGDYSFAGLSTSGPIKVALTSVLGNASLHCQQYTEKTFSAASAENCCVITNNSSSINTIVYQVSSILS